MNWLEVIDHIGNHALHRRTADLLEPILDSMNIGRDWRLRVRRPYYRDVVIEVKWLKGRVRERYLVYIRGLSDGIGEVLIIDLQGLLTAVRVHGDDLAYVQVQEMVGTDGHRDPCFIIRDSVLRKWGVVLFRERWPWLLKAVARGEGAGG